MRDDIKWCAGMKDGICLAEPDSSLAKSYLNNAKSSLKRAETDLSEGDMLWATVVIYYAEYYALYAFLQRIGIKCGNHFCSMAAAGRLLGAEKVRTINEHKAKRIDAQYYMKVFEKSRVEEMLRLAKIFVSEYDNMVSNLSAADIQMHRETLGRLMEGAR